MAIKADSSGFLIGERRLKEMTEGINKTEDNTKQILQVLTENFKDLQKSYEQSNQIVNDVLGRQSRAGRSQDAAPSASRAVRTSVDAAEQAVKVTDEALKAVKTIQKQAHDAVASSSESSAKQRAQQARERDANGRFIGKDGAKKQGLWSRFKSKIGFGGKGGLEGAGVDVSGVDPTVDAMRELGGLLSPVKSFGKRVGSVGLKGLRGIWRMSSKLFGRGREEQLPKEQAKANKEAAKDNKKQNKLLKSILSAVWSQGGGGLLGGMGGWLGKLLKGGGKGLLKRIPILGALLGGGMLAKDWGQLDGGGKGKGIGSIIGTLVGGALGSFFGPVGTFAGAGIGGYLGNIFGEKVGKWTDSLEKQDFASIFKSFLKDVFGIGGLSKSGPAGIPLANAGQSRWQQFKGWAGDKLGIGGTTESVGDKIDYSNAPGNKNIAGNVATDKKARQLGMYNALRKAGYTHEQALAQVGQIGRENSFGDAMFGTHTDISHRNGQKIQNGGVMSWNGDRYKKFAKYMREQGLMDAQGNMPKTQAVLDAQARFMKMETDEPYYKNRMKQFNNNPHADPKSMDADMAASYGWARGQDYVRDKNGNFTIPFDWRSAEARAHSTIDSTVPLIRQQDAQLKKALPAAKGKTQQSSLMPKGATRPAPIVVPPISPALTKIGASAKPKTASTAPLDQGIGQTVSDRSLAHVQAGGIGFNQYNA